MLTQQNERKAFLGWMRETGNIFTGDEYQSRFGIWLSNKRFVEEHNRANLGFTVALNRLAHLTPAEYHSLLGFRNNGANNKAVKSHSKANDCIDWRSKGVVNPIQDQGQCGSCWAFSAIQAQESQYAITSGELQKLSEQNLVDCVTTCDGCEGGLMTNAYDYVIKYQDGKFMLENDYPYTAYYYDCLFDTDKAVSNIVSYINVVEGDENDLATKISTNGPAAVAIDASHYSFQLYSQGIYNEPSCSSYGLDHGVGCVGYGAEGSTKYWIVRNSWGLGWGEEGYIRMIKDKGNQCGIASMACIPVDK
ncbi:Clan CA, family C1, cathepsin L-like cysteine peptidase [Trichomonas vaginalis G3]|uniref:Clan CA, family C1, cathepsin L-like cysteine peptidase n=1 Tax=Trichomonas vaginalis (strain ATCC PRA-98 / G3) TaxID=412133 RepID=A2F2X0_TRIV3|nr:cysteine-type peptidase protein [Trichomonas vaginalis G3]EAY00763.1 Clan CA, family C1, cathepsin L-like cysteine peptidase [Trichomonas vaginalis G3]KAI5530733.1 cysteine-type peptidase protein [Trichomonas vaginalis G3]|eukprot:XP_001313692.1 Clan CA, family C1, cathepsin L-like cysteine peptidase [Trichomonas vaginalis G3]